MVIRSLTCSLVRKQKPGKLSSRRLNLHSSTVQGFKALASFLPTRIRNMKLLTDRGNPLTLKVLAAFNIAQKEVEVNVVERKSKRPLALRAYYD